MGSIMNWLHGARWRMSLSHCFEGLLIQVPVAFLAEFLGVVKTQSWWVGALAVTVWYWSRKKAEFEQMVKVPGTSNTTVWAEGWFPWQWGQDMMLDLLLPMISSAVLAFGLSYWVAHRV